MSEELPETADGAVRGFIALFLLGAVLEGWTAWHHDEFNRALQYWGVGAMLAALGVFWKKLRELLGPRFSTSAVSVATDFRWWIGSVVIILSWLTLSPYVEQQRWPFATWFAREPIPSVDQIADAVARKQPAVHDGSIPSANEIAEAIIHKLPSIKDEFSASSRIAKSTSRSPKGGSKR